MNFYEMGRAAESTIKGHPIAGNNKEFRKATKGFGKDEVIDAENEFRRGWKDSQRDWNNSSAKKESDKLWKEVCAQR